MGLIKKKRCCHCNKLFIPDARNAKRRRFCSEPECRKAGKTASRRRWLDKPENRDYFRGPENVRRVQEWRRVNPEYAKGVRKKKPVALQDPLTVQPLENNYKNTQIASQDLLNDQVYVLIGLIANFTGSALQDDIACTLRRLQQLGRDTADPLTDKGGAYGKQGSDFTPMAAQNPQTVQLGRPASGA